MILKNTFVVAVIVLSVIHLSLSKAIVDESNNIKEEICNLPPNVIQDIASYANTTKRIIDYFMNGPYKGKSWASLAKFVDKFGNRLSGSKQLEDSIDYMVTKLEENGLEKIHTEDVIVPYWTRGDESAVLLVPRVKKLPMLGLGYSIPTPPEGITAEVIVVKSYEDLAALPDEKVAGKIVLYDEEFISYGETVNYRRNGASEASRKGAVASIIRSVGDFSIATPHTGTQYYQEGVKPIPAAAITAEDADQIWRMQERNEKIVIKLTMSSKNETRISRNTIAELTGHERPDKVVMVSGHIDSWDVGDGAMDDAGGAFISWIAPAVLKELNLRPRRTLRAILWTSEELGLIGSEAYEKRHREDNNNLNFVMESDSGTFSPTGLVYAGSAVGECMVKEILKQFSSINADQFIRGSPGPDLGFFVDRGVPGGGLKNANENYFWYHHTEGDTMNVITPEAYDRCAAFWTAFSYVVADLTHDIPRE